MGPALPGPALGAAAFDVCSLGRSLPPQPGFIKKFRGSSPQENLSSTFSLNLLLPQVKGETVRM